MNEGPPLRTSEHWVLCLMLARSRAAVVMSGERYHQDDRSEPVFLPSLDGDDGMEQDIPHKSPPYSSRPSP